MYRATERHPCSLALALALFTGVASLAAPVLAPAQTIADYSRSQRAVLEADIARNTAKAMAGGPSAGPEGRPAANPGHMALPSAPTPVSVPSLPGLSAADRELALVGVIALTSRSMAELRSNGESHLLLQGDAVPGTPWVVATIEPERVVLKSGKARTKTLSLPSAGR